MGQHNNVNRYDEELAELIDPILQADTDDWWELAAEAGLTPTQLEEEIVLFPDDEQLILRGWLEKYEDQLLEKAGIRVPAPETKDETTEDVLADLLREKIVQQKIFPEHVRSILQKKYAVKGTQPEPGSVVILAQDIFDDEQEAEKGYVGRVLKHDGPLLTVNFFGYHLGVHPIYLM